MEKAVELFSSLRSILQRGGFNLSKWRSSSLTVLQSIPQDLQEKLPVKDVTTLQSSSHPKALGLEWDSRQDCMSPSINVSHSYRTTKRGIISDVSKTFDILGWISPAVLSMKLLYQQLWEKGQEWDDTVAPDVAEHHAKWREELPCLSQRQLPRCYTLPDSSPITQELHGFSDASLKAYGAVVYLRTTYQHHPPTVSLVTAKMKVAKKNPPTVPKLELCGAVLLTKLLSHVSSVLNIPIEQHCLEGHVLLSGLTLAKHSFTYVLLKFYVLGISSTSCSKLSRWTTFITRFYSWFTHCAQQGKTTGKTSVHLVHHAVKH